MSDWVETNNGNYLNLNSVAVMFPAQSGSDWVIQTNLPTVGTQILKGTYTSSANAREAIRKLVHGIDPTTVV